MVGFICSSSSQSALMRSSRAVISLCELMYAASSARPAKRPTVSVHRSVAPLMPRFEGFGMGRIGGDVRDGRDFFNEASWRAGRHVTGGSPCQNAGRLVGRFTLRTAQGRPDGDTPVRSDRTPHTLYLNSHRLRLPALYVTFLRCTECAAATQKSLGPCRGRV
jgi:hypothetical protein